MNIYSAAVTLFLIMNPLGNVPVFISTLQHTDPKRRLFIIAREAIFALLILNAFLFSGREILHGLQVSESALNMAGGIILFLIAIKLIFPPSKVEADTPTSEPFLVPLAIPLFAGPATMAMTILLADQYPKSIWHIFIALLLAWGISSVILLASAQLSKLLGQRGLTAIERLMGMILTTVSVQMFFTGIQHFFNLS